MVYAMSSIGVLGFIVWAFRWAYDWVIFRIITWLYAGKPNNSLITRINLFNTVNILMQGQLAGNLDIGAPETTRHALNKDLHWAIGFFEAEGTLKVINNWIYISINQSIKDIKVINNRIYITISQSIKDIKAIYLIKRIFDLSQVKIRKDSRYCDWKLSNKDLNKIIKFIQLINWVNYSFK